MTLFLLMSRNELPVTMALSYHSLKVHTLNTLFSLSLRVIVVGLPV